MIAPHGNRLNISFLVTYPPLELFQDMSSCRICLQNLAKLELTVYSVNMPKLGNCPIIYEF